MPTLPCLARPVLAAHYSTAHEFFDAVAKGSDESMLKRIVLQRGSFFVGGRGYRLVVENAAVANARQPVDVRLERNWRELGWFRRVVLTLLSCVVPRDRYRCERPCHGQVPAVLHTITRLRQRAGMAVSTVPPSANEARVPSGTGVDVDEPRPRISPVLSPEARRVRLNFLAERIRKADRCKLFAHKGKWCKVVRAIAGNDPPECLDVAAAAVLAQMAAVVRYLRRNRSESASAYAEVMGVLQALRQSADAKDEQLAELAARLTDVWKQHWWRGEIPRYSAFADFRLPVGVVQRVGACLREDWLLVNDELCTLDLRDRQIKRLLAAASAKSTTTTTTTTATTATTTAGAGSAPAVPSLATG